VVDLCAATNAVSSMTYARLTNAAHTNRIKVLGTNDAASTGTAVAVDGWIVR
jgi:hypothetical protein